MKEIIGYIKEVTYGKVQISVPDTILERDSAGGTCYTSSETEVTGWEEDK